MIHRVPSIGDLTIIDWPSALVNWRAFAFCRLRGDNEEHGN